MTLNPSKCVYLSYVKNDEEIAHRFKSYITDYIDDIIWTTEFDLNGGDLIFNTIDTAISGAKWFILFLSNTSIQSKWVKTEANLATFRAIEDENFEIIIFQLEELKLPKFLKLAFENIKVIDLREGKNIENKLLSVVEMIEKKTSTIKRNSVYVDRGNYEDQFDLISRRNQIIFILGLSGIGKTSFIKNSVPKRLNKYPITIKLTKGHSNDLLARQILQRTHTRQPIDNGDLTGDNLISLALDELNKRSDKSFLFIDNSEEGLDPSNHLLSYLSQFLDKFLSADIKTHVILSTTRNPDYSPKLVQSTDILEIKGLDDVYIKECIDLNLEKHPKHDEVMNSFSLDELIKLINGHPLAAKMISSRLKIKSIEQLLQTEHTHKLNLQFAEYILRSTDQLLLSDLHQLFLQILAAIREPVLLEDMLSVKELKNYSLDEIQKVKWELSDWFLIESNGEMMSLHNFLEAYFVEKINPERWNDIANNYGHYAYEKTKQLNNEFSMIIDESPSLNEEIIKVTNNIFRYCLPAGRLLRAIGRDDLAEDLPIEIHGTIREMVFYFYQIKRDYKIAASYAEKWLKLSPNDTEILLYHARCYRNFRSDDNLEKAERIINKLESVDRGPRLLARILREKALIAQFKGEIDKAKDYFQEGINAYTPYPYPENHIGLAQLLLMELDNLPYENEFTQEKAEEAVKLLEEARSFHVHFDRYHLSIYIDALIKAGMTDIAFPLLGIALTQKPDDPSVMSCL